EDLGGAHVHNTKSGNAHLSAKTEAEALQMVRELLSYIPDNFEQKPPRFPVENETTEDRPDLIDLVPYDTTRPYDMKRVITEVVDENSFFELHKQFARNVIVGFARIKGDVVGIVANQPRYMAGSI